MGNVLQVNSKGSLLRIKASVFDEIKPLKPLLNNTAWEILKFLAKKPSYPSEIAKRLQLHEQQVYYCIKQMKQSGLIQIVKTEEIQGAVAKYFAPSSESFCLIPSIESSAKKTEFEIEAKKNRKIPQEVKEFFEPFIQDGKLSAKIIIGSSDPHGQFKARARDTHLAVELAAFLASLAEEIKFPLVFLDTQIKSLESENSNLIIVGGPITNKLCEEINPKLQILFSNTNGHWLIKSKLSEKEYIEDAIGIVEKTKHPFHSGKSVLLIAGNRNAGTRAAILSLIKNIDEIIKPNSFNENSQAKVVEGLDMDGDGTVDHVEIKE